MRGGTSEKHVTFYLATADGGPGRLWKWGKDQAETQHLSDSLLRSVRDTGVPADAISRVICTLSEMTRWLFSAESEGNQPHV